MLLNQAQEMFGSPDVDEHLICTNQTVWHLQKMELSNNLRMAVFPTLTRLFPFLLFQFRKYRLPPSPPPHYFTSSMSLIPQ